MNYTPKHIVLTASPDSVDRAREVCRRYLAGEGVKKIQSYRLPYRFVLIVRRDMKAQGIERPKRPANPGQFEATLGHFKPRKKTLDRAGIKKRLNMARFDYSGVATPDELAERRRKMGDEGWPRPAA